MSTILSWDERYKKNLEAYKPDMDSDINEIKAYADKKAQTISKLYEGKIAYTNQLYEDDLRANEVQKYINAREVAENNANLGLTDSGLNRTQQTAVQLSASNNAAKIESQRQSAVDELTRLMAADLSQIEDERYSSEQSIRSGYKQMASQAATDTYKADLEAYNKQVEAKVNIEKEQNSAYTNLISSVGNIEKTTATKIAEIYNYVTSYDTDFTDEKYYTNPKIIALLSAAGIPKNDWRTYFIQMENINEPPILQSTEEAARRANARAKYIARQKTPLSSSRIAGQGFKY